MIYNDAIHVQAEGREDGNSENIGILKVDDYLCVVHGLVTC
jgi:hypothetical protein